MKKILSLALAASMCASLMLTTTAVNAETTSTDLVPLYDFNDLPEGEISAEKLNELGIKTDGLDGNVTMTIVDMSADPTYSSLGKVLKYEPTSADTGTVNQSSIAFPIKDYSLKSGEKLVVEYVFHFDATGSDISDCFESGKFGSVGQLPITFAGGGNGWQIEIYSRGSGYRTWTPLYNTKAATVVNSGWYLVKQEIDYDAYLKDNTAGIKYSMIDVATGKAPTDRGAESGATYGKGHVVNTTVTDLTFSNKNGAGQVWIDNIHVYTVPAFTFKSSTIENNETGVFYDTKKITAEFTNDIENADTVSVKLNGVSIDGSLYTVTKSGRTVTVAFNENLKYESEYTVDYTGITDVLGQTLSDTAITFTTEEAPDVQLGELKLTENIGSTYQTVSNITAKNGLQGAELSLNNTAAEAKNVSVIFAVYAGESRILKDMIFTETTIPAGETKVISQGLTFNDENSGGIVKVFVWDGTATMRPWLRGTQLEIR